MKFIHQFGFSKTFWIACSVVFATLLSLWLMGRNPICECGYIKFWHSEIWSSENSQHFSDFYTFTHILHGFVFYFILSQLAKFEKLSFLKNASTMFLCALAIECAWELVENTDLIIDRYRQNTLSLDYYGDSIINSFGDVLAMVVGYALAANMPWWKSLIIIVVVEVILLVLIRDNLALNVLMLLYPFEAVKIWQAG